MGTVDYIPMWDTASDIIDSIIFQKSSEIGINTTTPAALLDVNGKTDVRDTFTLFPKSTDNTLAINGTAFKIDQTGKVTFITGQTFPGTGTITGITTASGSGLSGGGTTGTLSLKVPSAGITNAMLANSKITLNASAAGGLTVPGAMTLGSTYTIGLKTCSANQVLEYIGSAWTCASAGTGTITGVTAGTDLTGGGTSGAVTLNLDTTKVPLLSAANTFTGNQIVTGTMSATSTTAGAAAVSGTDSATTGTSSGVSGTTKNSNGYGVSGVNNATSGLAIAVNGISSKSTSGIGVSGYTSATTGTTFGVFGTAASPTGYGVYGVNTSTTPMKNPVGVYGVSNGDGSTGVPVGVLGTTTSSTGVGVSGQSTAASGTGVGVSGQSTATKGVSFGVSGTSASPSGYGVYGLNNATTGNAYGVFGQSNSTTGFAVYGINTASGYGVYGSSVTGVGILGTCAPTGSNSCANGVAGLNLSTSGAANGLWGLTGSPGGNAVYLVNTGGVISSSVRSRMAEVPHSMSQGVVPATTPAISMYLAQSRRELKTSKSTIPLILRINTWFMLRSSPPR